MRSLRLAPLLLLPVLGCPDKTDDPSEISCEVEGTPCALADEPVEVWEASEALADEVSERLFEGQPTVEIAQWLMTQGAVDVDTSEHSVWFRLEGGLPRHSYSAPYDDVISPAGTSSISSSGRGLVVRREEAPSEEAKRALIVDSYAYQFNVDEVIAGLVQDIKDVRDYRDRVDFRANSSGGYVERLSFDIDDAMRSFEDYEFIWLIGHGTRTQKGHTMVASSDGCGVTGFIVERLRTGTSSTSERLDVKRAADQNKIKETFGTQDLVRAVPITLLERLPLSLQKRLVMDAYPEAFKAYLEAERKQATLVGKVCDNMSISDQLHYEVWNYNEDWFKVQYPSGISDTILYLSLCQSDALPLRLKGESAYLGWTQNVRVDEELKAAKMLLEALFFEGLRLGEAFDKVVREGLDRHVSSTGPTQLQFVGTESRWLRVREMVEVIDQSNFRGFDESGTVQALSVEGDTTWIELPIRTYGYQPDPREDYELSIVLHSPNGETELFPPIDPHPLNGNSGETLDYAVQLPARVAASSITFDIEVRVHLAPSERRPNRDEYSRHRLLLEVLPVPLDNWWYVIGSQQFAGESTYAAMPQAVPGPNGELEWPWVHEANAGAGASDVSLTIAGHPGRSMDCTGPTGTYEAFISTTGPQGTVYVGGRGFAVTHPDDETQFLCEPTQVEITITAFSREEGVRARVEGTACATPAVGPAYPTRVSGNVFWPSAGCGPPPTGDLVGSYIVNGEPGTCFDVYPEASIAAAWTAVCMQPDLVCDEDACTTDNQIGECDFRNAGAQSAFRGLIMHVYNGPDVVLEDQRMACSLQGGTWQDS